MREYVDVLMTRLNRLPIGLQQSLQHRRLIKVIAGLTNFERQSVERVSRAGGGAGLIYWMWLVIPSWFVLLRMCLGYRFALVL